MTIQLSLDLGDIKSPVLRLHDYFPEADRWGVMGTVASAKDRWTCDVCGCRRQLVVWASNEVIFCGCFNCKFAD